MRIMWMSIGMLVKREWLRFLRQRSRVLSSVATPVLFWIVMGMGFGSSMQSPGSSNYLQFFFPGVLLMTLLFSSIFSMISLIEDRNQGFLQSVMVSPASHFSMILGKILGASTLSVFQTILLLPLAHFAGFVFHSSMLLLLMIIFFVTALLLCSLSFLFAWYLNSTQGFHAVMNILLFPMWLLSGAVFPIQNSSSTIQWIARINPMTYSVHAIRDILSSTSMGMFSQQVFLLGVCICLIFSCFWIVKRSYQ